MDDRINELMVLQDYRYLVKHTISEHDELMHYLRFLFPFVGLIDKTCCNYFMCESGEL